MEKEELKTKYGLVLCGNCDTPASWKLSAAVGWMGCAPCITGSASDFDEGDLIPVESIDNFLKEFNSPPIRK